MPKTKKNVKWQVYILKTVVRPQEKNGRVFDLLLSLFLRRPTIFVAVVTSIKFIIAFFERLQQEKINNSLVFNIWHCLLQVFTLVERSSHMRNVF